MPIDIIIHPREKVTREVFVRDNPPGDVALDGYVCDGPFLDEDTLHANFDHHRGVIRDITMCTGMQVYYAIKGRFVERRNGNFSMHIDDVDQDGTFATWLLKNYRLFTGVQSNPAISRALELTNKLDITGGMFPMSLRDETLGQLLWISKPYADARKSGRLAQATADEMMEILHAVHRNLDDLYIGKAQTIGLDDRHEIYYQSPRFGFEIVREIGGNDARYYLASNGHLWSGFVSVVAAKPDGTHVYTIGKPFAHIDFPVNELYDALNAAEGLTRQNGWDGSTIIGGSNRNGSKLSWQQIRDVIEEHLAKRKERRATLIRTR